MSSPFATADAKVAECERFLNYTFVNKHLCLEALQKEGWPLPGGAPVLFDGEIICVPKNDKLANHGDIVLDFVINTLWIRHRATGTFSRLLLPEPHLADCMGQRLSTSTSSNRSC